MPALGPLDRRTLKKRCLACTRRKIKCEGGPPCLYCTKKKQRCVPQAVVPNSGAVFINTCAAPWAGDDAPHPGVLRKTPTGHSPIQNLYSTVPLEKPIVFAGHFFSEFLAANDFAGALDLNTIITQFQSSPSLYYASIAVGALDLSNKLLQAPTRERKDARVGALTAYRTSIASFRKDIINGEVKQNDSSLWSTLFLSLFEFMYDDTGEGFVKHFLHGTSKILQIRGPDAHLRGTGRSFFQTVRVFEICRALIYANYSEPSFLCEPSWRELTKRISHQSEVWHPKEILFDLMIDCSSLSNRVWEALQPDSNAPCEHLENVLHELATEGLIFRDALDSWHTNFQKWTLEAESNSSKKGQSILATLYFHAISIFLSGIFDYRREFDHIVAPILSQNHIQYHVDTILSGAQVALNTTNLGGVLFFFPLRVAGSRVTTKGEAGRIVGMLVEISKRSFVVADAFILDLKALWLRNGL